MAAELRCVRGLRRERSARGSTSKPLAAASGPSASSCISSFRAAGLHARSSFLRGPTLIAYAEQLQSPAHATVKRCSPRSRRSLVERRRTAAAPGQKKNANPGKRICSRQTEAARTKLEAGSERKMESSYADHHKCTGSEGYSSGKCRPGCMETSHLRRELRWLGLRGRMQRLEATCAAEKHACTLRGRNGTGHPGIAGALPSQSRGLLLRLAHRKSETLVRCCAPALKRLR